MSRTLFSLFLIVFLATASNAQTAEDLFQQAIRVERLSGNAEAAIELYKQIVDEHSSNRDVTASALLQLGKAYEILGRDEASSAYSRILAEYSDFAKVAQEARAGISRTSQDQSDVSGKTSFVVQDLINAWGSSLSRSGKYFVGISFQTSHPAYIEIQSQQYQETVTKNVESGYGEWARISPDDSKIAFGWYPGDRGTAEIRIVDVNTGTSRLLYDPTPFLEERLGEKLRSSSAYVHDWTSDGQSILVLLFWGKSNQPSTYINQMLALIPVDGGEPRVVLEGESMKNFGWQSACLTKSDLYVMADFVDGDTWYIMRIDTQTGESIRWRYSDSQSYMLYGCANNKNQVLYSSELFEETYLYAGSLTAPGNGLADEKLTTLPENGWGVPGSLDGDIVSVVTNYKNSLRVLETDPSTGTVVGAGDDLGNAWTWGSDWTADSRRIVYARGGGSLVIYEPDSKAETKIAIGQVFQHPRWLYGDTQILAYDRRDAEGKRSAYVLDSETGELIRTIDKEQNSKIHGLTTDIDRYISRDLDRGCFTTASLSSDEIHDFFCPSGGGLLNMGVRHSPDFTQYLVYTTSLDTLTTIGVVSADGTGYKPLMTGDSSERIGRVKWGQESQILFSTHDSDTPSNRIPVKFIRAIDTITGEVKSVYPSLSSFVNIRDFSLSPDGKHLVLQSSTRADQSVDAVTVYHDVLNSRE